MAIRLNTIVVIDFETGSLEADKDSCEVLQIGCLAIDPVALTIIKGSEFCEYCRPVNPDNLTPEAMSVNGITQEQWSTAPVLDVVFPRFAQHVRQFNPKGKSLFDAPHAAGKNIRGFDLKIVDRLARKYKFVNNKGVPNLFDWRLQFDVEDDLIRWLWPRGETDDLKMDTIRPYFGLKSSKSHDALEDCRQEAALLIEFLRLYSDMAKRINFRGSLAGK